jgi:hypothetical protein
MNYMITFTNPCLNTNQLTMHMINQKQNESLTGSSYIDNTASYSPLDILVLINRQAL